MNEVSMLEFRRNAKAVIQRALRGQRIILTYRGKPVLRLEPIESGTVDQDDPIYSLADLADPEGEPLSNREMDRIIYET